MWKTEEKHINISFVLTVGKRIRKKLKARETSKGMKSIIDNVDMTGLILFAFIAMLMIALKK